jgi:hypothetical protein
VESLVFQLTQSPLIREFVQAAGALDVNQDGIVSPLDALFVINLLNISAADRASAGQEADVSGDHLISPVDVLMIINYLNADVLASLQSQPLVDDPEATPAEGEVVVTDLESVDSLWSDENWMSSFNRHLIAAEPDDDDEPQPAEATPLIPLSSDVGL